MPSIIYSLVDYVVNHWGDWVNKTEWETFTFRLKSLREIIVQDLSGIELKLNVGLMVKTKIRIEQTKNVRDINIFETVSMITPRDCFQPCCDFSFQVAQKLLSCDDFHLSRPRFKAP